MEDVKRRKNTPMGLLVVFLIVSIAIINTTGCRINTPIVTSLPEIRTQPEIGQYLFYDDQTLAGVLLESVDIGMGICDKDYIDIRNGTVKKGEACLLITGVVESQLGQDKYMSVTAIGYDSKGNEVTYTLDAGPIWGVISLFLEARSRTEFVLHLKAASDIALVELKTSRELYDLPPP